MSVQDLPDRDIETVAFHHSLAYKVVLRTTDRPWWRFWKSRYEKVAFVHSDFWHLMVELGPTNVDVIVLAEDHETYCGLTALMETVPKEFDYPPIALVPHTMLQPWVRRHRVLYIADPSQYDQLQTFITRNSLPESD